MGFSRLQLKKDATPIIFYYTPINATGHKRKTTEDDTRSAKQGRSSRVLEKKACIGGKRFSLNSGQISLIHINSGYFL